MSINAVDSILVSISSYILLLFSLLQPDVQSLKCHTSVSTNCNVNPPTVNAISIFFPCVLQFLTGCYQ